MKTLANNISLVAQTEDLHADKVEIVVTVPTFKRPKHLLRTLDSLAGQTTARPFAVVVMENEAEAREGANAAAPHFTAGNYKGIVIIAHDRGNCSAYNAGWETALKQFTNLKYIAVIDDDELAHADWLENLCLTAEKYDAALVAGPQKPIFDASVQEKWKDHPVFKPHYTTTGPVDIIYSSGNLLARRDFLDAMNGPFFDLDFNFTGGGDSDLFRRARDAGFKMAWCDEAYVEETVPARRVTWQWIRNRALRNGQLSAAIAHRRSNSVLGKIKVIAHSLALLAASPARAFLKFMQSGSLLTALYPVHVAIGRIASEFGYANEQYRNPEKN